MRENIMVFSKNIREKREKSFGLENALAGYCRRRWPDKPIQHIAREWALTESEASSVLYALASKRVFNKIIHHRRGGPFLFFHLAADVVGATVEDVIQQQAEEIEDAANKQALAAIRFRSLASRLAASGADSLARRARRDSAGPEPRL
jgi:hypothetical protein